jgi:hypothetical protein
MLVTARREPTIGFQRRKILLNDAKTGVFRGFEGFEAGGESSTVRLPIRRPDA